MYTDTMLFSSLTMYGTKPIRLRRIFVLIASNLPIDFTLFQFIQSFIM